MKFPAFAVGFAFGLAAFAAHADVLPVAVLSNASIDFAINPETGVVAAVEPEKDAVRFYPNATTGSVEGAMMLPLPQGTVSILFKKYHDTSYFIVLCHTIHKAILIDGVSLRQSGEIRLPADDNGALVASVNPEDPYVYIPGRGPKIPPPEAMVIDLRVQKEVGTVQLAPAPDGSNYGTAISADGRTVYGTPWNTRSVDFWIGRLTPQEAGRPPALATAFTTARTANGDYVPDPFSQMVAIGRDLFSPDLKVKLATTEAPAACFLPQRPYMIGLTLASAARSTPALGAATRAVSDRIHLISSNTFKTVATLDLQPRTVAPLPALTKTFRLEDGQFAYRQRVLFDARNERVLVCDFSVIRPVSLKDFKAPEEPFLTATVEGSTRFALGRSNALRLTIRDPKVNVELKDAPAGMALNEGTITWTPGSQDLGEVKLGIRLSGGSVERTQALSVTVSQPMLQLPFDANWMVVSPDGSKALVTTAASSIFPSRSIPKPSLLLLDTKSLTILAQQTFDGMISTLTLDNRYAYLGLNNSNALAVLSLKDLSELRRIATDGRVMRIFSKDSTLVTVTNNGLTRLINTGDFSPLESPGTGLKASNSYPPRDEPLVDLGDHVLINGIMYSPDLRKIDAIIRTDTFKIIGDLPPRGPFETPLTPRWGVSLQSNGTLIRPNGQLVGSSPPWAESAILLDRPMVASLKLSDWQRGSVSGGKAIRAEMAFRDLVTDTVQETIPLMNEVLLKPPQLEQRFVEPTLRVAGDRLLLLLVDRIFSVPLPPADAVRFPEPLGIAADQGLVVLSPDKPITLQFHATGGSGTVTFATPTVTPGLELKPDGTMTIQPATWSAQAINVLSDRRPRIDPQSGREIEPDLAEYQKSASAMFKLLTGRQPAGIPVAVGVTVTAQDKSQHAAKAYRLLLLDVPADKVMARINQPQTDAARLDALEKQVIDLNTKIDALTKSLNELRAK